MNVTDEMVERAAAATFALQQAWDEPFSEHSEFTWTGLNKERTLEARKFRSLARAALTAALGDVEPLADVLQSLVTATDYLTGAQQKIMEARAAVANAKEQSK